MNAQKQKREARFRSWKNDYNKEEGPKIKVTDNIRIVIFDTMGRQVRL